MNGGAFEFILWGRRDYITGCLQSYDTKKKKKKIRNSTPPKLGESFVSKAVNSQKVGQRGRTREVSVFKLRLGGKQRNPKILGRLGIVSPPAEFGVF